MSKSFGANLVPSVGTPGPIKAHLIQVHPLFFVSLGLPEISRVGNGFTSKLGEAKSLMILGGYQFQYWKGGIFN